MKTVEKTTQNFAKIARDKMQEIRDEYRVELAKQEKIVMPKVTAVNELYDQQVTQTTRNYQRQLLPVQKDKVKLEKTKEQAIGRIEKAKAEAKASSAKKDEAREKKWKEKADESKKELSETENKLKQVEKTIRSIEDNKTAETFKIKSEREAKINEARKDILELENQRDAKIQLRQQEIEKLETLTTTMIQQISVAVKQRETDLSNFESLGIKQKRKELLLLYVPFYVASYQASSGKRYSVFTPSFVNNIGLSTKIKGALGRARYRNLLTPRFDSLAQLLHNVPIIAGQNAVLAREIDEAGSENDLTKTDEARGLLKLGLDRIRHEGWFSENEYDTIIGTLVSS
jgi:DNA repair exonuclease SbcCD ATPase subunit